MVILTGAAAVASPLWIEPPPLPWTTLPEPPEVEAESWLLSDETSQVILMEQEADLPRPMASTTKLMTALVAVEVGDLSSPVQVSREAAAVGEAGVDLVEGEVFLLRTLVRALLIRSGNDAAYAVAQHVGGSVEEFVVLMNERAAELGMDNTSFANPHGLDHPDQYSTARDLLLLTREVLAYPELAEAVSALEISLRDAPSGEERVFSNTNRMLADYEGAFGVKTGYTDNAGLVLVAGAQRQGHRLVAVVMNTTDHFADAEALLDFGFDYSGSVAGLIPSGFRLSRDQVLAASAPAGSTTTTTVAIAPESVGASPETEGEEPVGPVTVRVGRTPEGPGDVLGWVLRLFAGDG